jgi:hypothetical protein
MKVESLKDLAKLIALCRKTGVESIRVDGVELHLGPESTRKVTSKPQKSTGKVTQKQPENPTIDDILSDGLSPEQMLMWSVTPATDAAPAEEQQ